MTRKPAIGVLLLVISTMMKEEIVPNQPHMSAFSVFFPLRITPMNIAANVDQNMPAMIGCVNAPWARMLPSLMNVVSGTPPSRLKKFHCVICSTVKNTMTGMDAIAAPSISDFRSSKSRMSVLPTM